MITFTLSPHTTVIIFQVLRCRGIFVSWHRVNHPPHPHSHISIISADEVTSLAAWECPTACAGSFSEGVCASLQGGGAEDCDTPAGTSPLLLLWSRVSNELAAMTPSHSELQWNLFVISWVKGSDSGCKQCGALLRRAEWISNLSLPRGWFLCCCQVALELSARGAFTPKLISGLLCYEGRDKRSQQLSCLHPVLLVICLQGGIWNRKVWLGHSFCLLMTDHGCPVLWLVVGWLRWQMLQWFFWQYSVVLTVQTGNSSFSICTC